MKLEGEAGERRDLHHDHPVTRFERRLSNVQSLSEQVDASCVSGKIDKARGFSLCAAHETT